MTIQFFVNVGPLSPTDNHSDEDYYESHGPFASFDAAQEYSDLINWTFTISEYTLDDADSIVGIREISQSL